MTDEAHFHFSGLCQQRELSLLERGKIHSDSFNGLFSVHVCGCLVWSGKLGSHGPYFFEDEDGRAFTVTSARYVEMLGNLRTREVSR
jgi:hypothetical protein